MLTPETRIFVAGHRGMVGSAVCRALRARGCRNLLIRILGWTPTIPLEEGLRQTCADFVNITPTSAKPATVQTAPVQSRARG